MPETAYEEGQPVLVFEADRRTPRKGKIDRVGQDLVYVGVGAFHEQFVFRKSDQRRAGGSYAHLWHFRTLDQVAEEERYGKAVQALRSHGLVQEIGSRLPVQTLEKIVVVLEQESGAQGC